MLSGDAAAADLQLQRLATVQADEVRRLLREQLLMQPRVTLHYIQRGRR